MIRTIRLSDVFGRRTLRLRRHRLRFSRPLADAVVAWRPARLRATRVAFRFQRARQADLYGRLAAAPRRASSSASASSSDNVAGSMPFGTDALTSPSVT